MKACLRVTLLESLEQMQVERSHRFHGELSSGLARDGQTGPPTYLLKAAQRDGYHDTQKHLPNRE